MERVFQSNETATTRDPEHSLAPFAQETEEERQKRQQEWDRAVESLTQIFWRPRMPKKMSTTSEVSGMKGARPDAKKVCQCWGRKGLGARARLGLDCPDDQEEAPPGMHWSTPRGGDQGRDRRGGPRGGWDRRLERLPKRLWAVTVGYKWH